MNLRTRTISLMSAALLGAGLLAATNAAAAPTGHYDGGNPPASTAASVQTGGIGTYAWDPGRAIGPGRDACPTYYVCIWTGTNFTGDGRGYTGSISPGDVANWLGSRWQDNVHSAVNKTTIPVEFLNWNQTYNRWDPLGKLYPGYDFRSGWPGAHQADGLRRPN